MTRVLVTGTDRPIGKAILPRLVKHGFAPVAGVGDTTGPVMSIDHDLIADGKVDVELDSHSSISTALEGISTMIHAADVRPGGSHDIPDSMRALASACADRGVHLILISRVGADVSSLAHRKQLWKAEQVIEQTEGLGYTIQRITHTHPSVEKLLQGPFLPLPQATPIQPVSPSDVAGRVVGLVQVGPSQRVRDYGGPELMRFADAVHIYKQVRKTIPRKVPLPKVGVLSEALAGVHVTKTGDRGTETFRQWLTD
ncbi:MAG: hypothetical protein KC481_13110 [Acidimicrobiaceae bacterium]|nr:hypothetical protein [Acidimicrobiaceae bacterium]